jgi:putative peptidoglycan lipid II flippase
MANFSGLIDVAFASTVGAFGPAALDKAFRLIQLPYGVIAVAIGVVALAELARTSQQPHEFDHDLSSSVRLQLAILVPIAIVTAIAAEPIVRVIYERGAFNALSTEVTSHALVGFAPALPALGLSLIASRAWLSKKRPWIPAGVATAGLAMNALLDWILIGPFGIAGIGIATAVAHTAVGGVLLYSVAYDRRRVTAEVVGALGRLVLACALAAGAGFVVWVVARVAATQDVSTIAACAVFLVTLPAIGASLGLDDYRRAADALKARRKGDELVDGDVLG